MTRAKIEYGTPTYIELMRHAGIDSPVLQPLHMRITLDKPIRECLGDMYEILADARLEVSGLRQVCAGKSDQEVADRRVEDIEQAIQVLEGRAR